MSLYHKIISTPLGDMIAVADEHKLYALPFENMPDNLIQGVAGTTRIIATVEEELAAYFEGKLHQFKTPLHFKGTPFQTRVWEALCTIPAGATWSYAQLAASIDAPHAYRAVGNANGRNPFPVIVPCHRVIQADGSLGGYSSGLPRKEWLLAHEQKHYLKRSPASAAA